MLKHNELKGIAKSTSDPPIQFLTTIINTRPKPAYGWQGLAGSWGQDTDQAGTFWGVLRVSKKEADDSTQFSYVWAGTELIMDKYLDKYHVWAGRQLIMDKY